MLLMQPFKIVETKVVVLWRERERESERQRERGRLQNFKSIRDRQC